MLFKLIIALLLVPAAVTAGDFTSVGVGGGGALHAGAFLPSDPDVIVIGSDVAGAYLTADFGRNWYPWNEGLPNSDCKWTRHIEDLEGVDYNGWSGFYAATWGGIYRAPENGDWECMTPVPAYSYLDKEAWYADAIPFSCLDWNGQELLVAGAGRPLWNRPDYQTNFYPGLDPLRFEPYGAYDEQWTVWTLNLNDIGTGWQPDPGSTFGAARDIDFAIVDGVPHIAVATPSGIYVKDDAGWRSVGQVLYVFDLTCWSVRLTERGTLYAAVGRVNGSRYPTGVYRVFDITSSTSWSWVGDNTGLPPTGETLQQIGSGGPDLICLSVLEGQGDEPDLLYLGSRNSHDGLFRGYQEYVPVTPLCTWEHKVYTKKEDPLTFWYRDGNDQEQPLDVGWHPGLTTVTFHPIVSAFHPDRLAVQFGGRMHVSPDLGDTWLQRYTSSVGGSWRSKGYNELCVMDVTFMSDGRAVESTADHGVFRSKNESLQAWEYLVPPVDTSATPESDTAWTKESNSIDARSDWQGSGQDALFVVFGDRMARPCKLLMLNHQGSWRHITRTLNSNRYFFYDFVFRDDETCFIAYARYDAPACSPGACIEEFGVLKGTYSGDEWSWVVWNDGLLAISGPVSSNAIGKQFLYHESSGNLFLAACQSNITFCGQVDAISVPGGLYMLPAPPEDTTWKLLYGGDDSGWEDFRCLAQSKEGEVVYAGTRGVCYESKGSVFKCTNPGSAEPTWTPLANTPETGYPFGFEVPFWAPVGWDLVKANQRLTDVRALAVDPQDPDVVFVGIHRVNGFMKQEGVWMHDSTIVGIGGPWVQLSADEAFVGVGVTCMETNSTIQDRLLIGTSGLEVYYALIASLRGPEGQGESEFRAGAAPGLRLLAIRQEVGGRAEISFSLANRSRVQMDIFDVTGRLVLCGNEGLHEAGKCQLLWDGRSGHGRCCASGVYFVRLKADRERVSRKFVLLK